MINCLILLTIFVRYNIYNFIFNLKAIKEEHYFFIEALAYWTVYFSIDFHANVKLFFSVFKHSNAGKNLHMHAQATRFSVRRGRWLERSPIRQSITCGDLTWTWKQVLGIRFSILHTTLINAVRLLHRSLSLPLLIFSSSFVRLSLEPRARLPLFLII